MNWKKEAQDRLRNYHSIRHACRNIPQEIKRLENMALSPGRVSLAELGGMGTGRGDDKLINNIVYMQELQWRWEQTRHWLEVTDSALLCLEPEEKRILERLYMDQEKGGLERLCRELGVEQSSVYRRRDRALLKFTLALYGAEDHLPQMVS